MPNTRISNLVPATRASNLVPNLKVTSRVPAPSSSTFTQIGSPIGLLLVLTYAISSEVPGPSDLFRPNVRISNI